jgi:hypothetical protein
MSRSKKFHEELELYRAAIKNNNAEKVEYHLGRAHILSQNSTLRHLYVHWLMFIFALQKLDIKEIAGQTLRLIVTVPGHIIGKVPKGNIGWSTVGLTDVMDVPEDLKTVVEE